MNRLIAIERHRNGPRLTVCGRWRVHHWHCGVASVMAGLKLRDLLLVAFGLRLMWRDRWDLIGALLAPVLA